jgi:hypothetical protein
LEITFEDAVGYATAHLDDDRNVVHLTESYLANGWASPDPSEQQKLRDSAVAAVAEARRRRGLKTRGHKPRTGRAMFS